MNNEYSQYFFETSSTHVNLYDSDLNLVKSLKKFSSIESVFMNEKYIVVTHSHRSDGCCSIYDYRLNELALFGQQKDKDADFFMERLSLSWKEQNSLNYKINPKVFGLTEKLIYFYNHAEMTIMDRVKGKVVHKKQIISGDKPYFLLDTQGNIVQVNKLSKKVSVFNFDVELNESEINQKIHLPKLKELEIKKISLLNYFTDLRSLEIIEITWLDLIDY